MSHIPEQDNKEKELSAKIAKARQELEDGPSVFSAEDQQVSNSAWQILIEIAAGPAVGLLIGIALDRWLGTTPLFILLCLFLGLGGGFLNAYRAAMGQGRQIGKVETKDKGKE
ncbi:MAG: AtpZ/AtpI family protein [Dongiaceae bacterium]